jgi:putative methyltransferase
MFFLTDAGSVLLPRYVRVNTLKGMTVEQVKSGLQTSLSQNNKQNTVDCQIDAHIPELLVLPPSTDLHSDQLFTDGHIILQVST